MNVTELEDWKLEEDSDWRCVWQHKERAIMMTVSHQPDHYEDGEQVMRWHARATLGRNITFGQNHIVVCDDKTSDDEAKAETINWALSWMKNFTVQQYNIEETLEELEEMDEYSE